MSKIYGLIGKTLGHSFSPQIHLLLGGYGYRLFELEEGDVEAFLRKKEFDGINVTIPYKQTVMPYLDCISDEAMAVGSVNTVVKGKDGRLFGYNTDAFGFEQMLKKAKITVEGKKALVLGSGGASKTAVYVLNKLGALSVTVISRDGQDNYENIEKHLFANVIVNTTPVGMYPKNGKSPIDLSRFSQLTGAIELIYNPRKTAFVLQAENLGVPCTDGLYMLVAQAAKASELFTANQYTDAEIEKAYLVLDRQMSNITLVGMPGCGKSTVGRELASILGRELFDCDDYFEKKYGRTPAEVITEEGEAAFRKLETAVLTELTARTGIVLCTGGGAVTVEENHNLLRQNGKVVFIDRDISLLATENRPLSQGGSDKLEQMYQKRLPLYKTVCDFQIATDAYSEPHQTAKMICKLVK